MPTEYRLNSVRDIVVQYSIYVQIDKSKISARHSSLSELRWEDKLIICVISSTHDWCCVCHLVTAVYYVGNDLNVSGTSVVYSQNGKPTLTLDLVQIKGPVKLQPLKRFLDF